VNSHNQQKKQDEDAIFLIMEKHHQKNGTYIFDFSDYDSYDKFRILLGLEDEILAFGPSMVEIHNFKSGKRFKDGVYYKLNKKWTIENRQSIAQTNDSAVIGFIFNMEQQEIGLLFSGTGKPSSIKEIVGHSSDELNELLDAYFPEGTNVPFDELIVRYVEQGSWNEFLSKQHTKLVFDMGTIYTASMVKVKEFISHRDKAYQLSQPLLLLSHWDVDHYHMLLVAEDETIQAFTKFVFRNIIPNYTSYRVYERFLTLNVAALYPVRAEIPRKGRSSTKLKMIKSGNHLRMYNGSSHSDRNLSGIMLSVQTMNIGVVCAADFAYHQLQRDVITYFCYPHKHYLVVPHHGGDGGKTIYEPMGATKMDAVISTGKNPYGHPNGDVIEKLMSIKFHVINFACSPEHYYLRLR